MLKADFHIHTNEDPIDYKIKYNSKEMIKFCSKLGFNVLSITNHRNLFFNQDIKEYAKKRNILLIPGTEALIEGKEVLIINAPLDLNKRKINNINELENIKKENSVIIAPHPFYPRGNCLGQKLVENIELFDGIEYSHFYWKYFNAFNKKAVKVAKKYNKPLLGTSDAHSYSQFNNTFSALDCEQNLDSVLEAIRTKKIKLITRPLKFKQFFRIGINSVINLIKPKTI